MNGTIFTGKSADGSDAQVTGVHVNPENSEEWSNIPYPPTKGQKMAWEIYDHRAANNRTLKEEYDLILVDEAHRYRNHNSTMFNNLQRICKSERIGEGLVVGKRKKVMLISATPLNNRPQDLYYQLLFWIHY